MWPRLPVVLVRMSGVLAVASALAYAAYWLIQDQPEWAITAWNLLIIPATLVLATRAAPRGALIAATAAAAGVSASLLWAFGYETAGQEPWWIGLAAASWLGLGWLLVRDDRRLGWLTIVLGISSAVDFVVTIMNASQPLLGLGGAKIPLTMVWSAVVGVALTSDPAPQRAHVDPIRWVADTALVGGIGWGILGVGWTLAHGSTQAALGAELLGLRDTELTRLFGVSAMLWWLSLAAWPNGGRRVHVARIGAIIGVAMIGAGALLQTSLVDPDREFHHPAVQLGFLLFVAGLVPVMSLGLLGAAAWLRSPRVVREALAFAGVLAAGPVLAFFLSETSDGGTAWIVIIGALHAAPGIGWVAVAIGLASTTVSGGGAPPAPPHS